MKEGQAGRQAGSRDEREAGRQPGWAYFDRLASNESSGFCTPNEPLDEVVSGEDTYEYDSKSIWPNMICDTYCIRGANMTGC